VSCAALRDSSYQVGAFANACELWLIMISRLGRDVVAAGVPLLEFVWVCKCFEESDEFGRSEGCGSQRSCASVRR
jgi:hypothetical protein